MRRTAAAGPVLVMALAVTGCGPTAGSPADDTRAELAERLAATDGVRDVRYEAATGESDSGEPGEPPELDVELDADADAAQLTAVLDIIETNGDLPGAVVALGEDGATLSPVDDGAPVERGAEVLLAAVALAVEHGLEPSSVGVSLARPEVGELGEERPGPFEPGLTMSLPPDDVASITAVAEDLAADPTFDGVDVALWATARGSTTPSLSTGDTGMTDEVLASWSRVRAATRRAPEGATLLPGYAEGLTDGTSGVSAGLSLRGSPRHQDVTAAAYGDRLRPALCALADVAREGPRGSDITLTYDGQVLGDVTVDGENTDGFGRRGWNRLLRTCLAR